MAVIKKSSSGRAIQFITDEGVVYQLSAKLFGMVVNDSISGDFVVLTRMPIPVPSDKFPKSQVYGDASLQSAVNNAGDVNAFSKSFVSERKAQKVVKKASEVKGNW